MKKENLRLAIAQINCTVGDLEGNFGKIKEYIQKAEIAGVDIVAFPELAVTGYPPEDLLLKPQFVEDGLKSLKKLLKFVHKTVVIIGFVDKIGKDIYNAAALLYDGKIKGVYRKTILPNYGVFDERRYFEAGEGALVFKFGEYVFGVNICEDIWHKNGPVKLQATLGAKLIININASPYHAGKIKQREDVLKKQAKANRVTIAYINLVAGQDELVFDGQSMIVDSKGRIIKRLEAFREELAIADLDIPVAKIKSTKAIVRVADKIPPKNKISLSQKAVKPLEPVAEIYQALILGLKDYVRKNSFKKVIIGLSGGVDSALVALLAVDAIGKDNVIGVFMPSRYSSQESEEDAKALAKNLGIDIINVPIEELYKMYLAVLTPIFSGQERNIAEENLQARIRGNILMALSNKFGYLVLSTGNKSEMSTGYATLYGDMAGGFAVIKDVPKILVYELCRWRNSSRRLIPERILTKAPTAELKENQKDSDTLPPYEDLDAILKAYVEEDKAQAEITRLGFDKKTVHRVLEMVDKSEYKRRQAPPGIKITPKAFGKDRRMPITNKYRD